MLPQKPKRRKKKRRKKRKKKAIYQAGNDWAVKVFAKKILPEGSILIFNENACRGVEIFFAKFISTLKAQSAWDCARPPNFADVFYLIKCVEYFLKY
jgi:hypothetical protein